MGPRVKAIPRRKSPRASWLTITSWTLASIDSPVVVVNPKRAPLARSSPISLAIHPSNTERCAPVSRCPSMSSAREAYSGLLIRTSRPGNELCPCL